MITKVKCPASYSQEHSFIPKGGNIFSDEIECVHCGYTMKTKKPR